MWIELSKELLTVATQLANLSRNGNTPIEPHKMIMGPAGRSGEGKPTESPASCILSRQGQELEEKLSCPVHTDHPHDTHISNRRKL